jgi:hypothetical protein
MTGADEIRGERLAKKSPKTAKHSAELGVGVALWESAAGEWVLLKCGCADGYHAGPPPAEPGTYEGQILQKLCEPIDP